LGKGLDRVGYLVGGRGDEGPAEALGDLLLLLLRLLGGLAVGVELTEAGEEDEAAERRARRVEHQLLHEPRRVRGPHRPRRWPPCVSRCLRRKGKGPGEIRGRGIRFVRGGRWAGDGEEGMVDWDFSRLALGKGFVGPCGSSLFGKLLRCAPQRL
jgi:hypothetical protein